MGTSDTLERLALAIKDRRAATAGTSYTRQLLDGGPEKCAKKFGEEAVEVVLAGAAGAPEHLKAEAADVLYHLLVLLECRDVALVDVMMVLETRMGTSGLAEKAARPKG